jgi:hypothetical protein
MFRKLTAVLVLVLAVACVSAKEYMGSITKVDSVKKTMTVKVGDEEKTFAYSDKTEFIGRKGNTQTAEQVSKQVEKAAEKNRSVTVTITTEEADGKEVVKEGNPFATKVSAAKKK